MHLIGKVLIGNQALLKQIQGRHTGGIYTENDFFAKIRAGFAYFSVKTNLETGECGLAKNTLESLGRYSGPVFEHKGKLVFKNINDDKSRFVFELFPDGSGCFLNENEAVNFRNDIVASWDKLISVV